VTNQPRRFTRGAAAYLQPIADPIRRLRQTRGLTHRRRRTLTGLLYVAPALLFVVVFTMIPFLQMIWVSLHSWSLITPPRFIGLANFERALSDDQFWVSLWFTLKYTLLITPILMIGGYLIAVMTSVNSPLRRLTRTVLFVPVVIGLGASSLLWFWLFSPNYGLINKFLLDVGLIGDPILWLGVDADRSNWAVITSVVWKVLGFGVILFVAAIQAIPSEVNEASMVDGASLRQRVSRVMLPMTMRTVLLVTLVSVIGSLLAFDQFYLMTAGQPHNETATSVFWVYQNSFPFLKLGYGAALSLILAAIILAFTIGQMVLTRRSHA
jgi:multiple sugar transport system permease protein